MTSQPERQPEQSPRIPRLWPAIAILLIQAVAMILTVTPSLNNLVRFLFMLLAPAVCGALFVGWLLLGSRLTWRERFAFLVAPALLAVVVSAIADSSMEGAWLIYGAPFSIAVIALGTVLTRHHGQPTRRIVGVITGLVLVWGVFPLVRIDGFTGDYMPELSWRWSPTYEAGLAKYETLRGSVALEWAPSSVEWPGFRGPERDGRVMSAATTSLDWADAPPDELWRIAIGPAWSSFAYASGRLFTQQQRGAYELVTCHDAETGELIWKHADESRFSETVSGPGPRATPTLAQGRVYTYGARALLNCLKATDGECVWQRDLMRELDAPLPIWGFSSSPLVTDGVVIVYVGAAGDRGLVAFDAATGAPAWQIASRGMNFSSAQRVTIDGQSFVLFANASGLVAVEPATGAPLWKYRPARWSGPGICQPQQIGPSSLIVPLGDGVGVARVEVSRQAGGWNITESWSSRRLKPSFNDFVYHDGHLYGFDQNIYTSIDAATGERNWKDGRFGFGQVLLLAGRSQLIVTGEDGSVILLSANPSGLEVLGRIQPLTGKTWNHPIVANDRLFLRNGEYAVCLALVG